MPEQTRTAGPTPLSPFRIAFGGERRARETRPLSRRLGLIRTEDGARGNALRACGASRTEIVRSRLRSRRRSDSLALLKAQTSSGGFPWWPGGPPSPYMTIYILHAFANAL
jgi:hypothetical protein